MINKNIKHSYNRILEISEDHKQITLPDSRYYRRNTNYYPSVTYVLSMYPKGKFFEDWLKKVGYASVVVYNNETVLNERNAIDPLYYFKVLLRSYLESEIRPEKKVQILN